MASSKRDRRPLTHDQPVEQEADVKEQPDEPAGKKHPSPSQCRNFTRKKVAKSLPDILDTFVDEAKSGSVSHFNQLAKFGGFDLRPIPTSVKRKGKSFAQRLLDDMKEHEAKMIAARDARLATERESGR